MEKVKETERNRKSSNRRVSRRILRIVRDKFESRGRRKNSRNFLQD